MKLVSPMTWVESLFHITMISQTTSIFVRAENSEFHLRLIFTESIKMLLPIPTHAETVNTCEICGGKRYVPTHPKSMSAIFFVPVRTFIAVKLLTNTAQCISKGMIAPSVSKNCMEYRYTLQNKIWVSFQTPRQLHHSITNEQSGFNMEQIKKD